MNKFINAITVKNIILPMAKTILFFLYLTNITYAAVLPDIPVPLKNGTGAIDSNGVVYVGLGSAGTAWYKIDLKNKNKIWKAIQPFPGAAREQSVSVFLNDELYVFGGVGKINGNSPLHVFSDVYKYSPQNNTWQQVNTIAPIGLTGHTGINLNNDTVLITGGVNKNIFDQYFQDLESNKNNNIEKDKVIHNYFNKPAKDYFFNDSIFIYNSTQNKWENAGTVPGLGTAGSAITLKDHYLTIINGEIKPGLRTDITHHAVWKNHKLQWLADKHLPPLQDNKYQEGLAGAFSGYSHGTLLVAGGANFPGATENYANGKYYSHEGISKKWHDEVYGLIEGHWQFIGNMKQAIGYGISITYDDTVYLFGGENMKGQPVSSITTLKMFDGKLKVE